MVGVRLVRVVENGLQQQLVPRDALDLQTRGRVEAQATVSQGQRKVRKRVPTGMMRKLARSSPLQRGSLLQLAEKAWNFLYLSVELSLFSSRIASP